MSMTYTSLTGNKGVPGSIMNWVSYTKLDQVTVVDEAQSLLFGILRVREMREEWTFGMATGQANQPLPARFLDPIGRIFDITNCTDYGQNLQTDIARLRSYDTSIAGTFAANPFTTTSGSSLVVAHQVAHGLNQDSTLTIAAAAAAGGLTLNGAFPVTSIVDADNFVIDAGNDATSSVTGGGSLATYTANKLIAGSPSRWGIWQELVKFDTAFVSPATLKLLFYRSPKPLSSTIQSNWLTARYPMLMRKACQASAADYMKDDAEYEKQVKGLTALIGSTAVGDDLSYRGAEFGTDTP